jgi:hypothetical protein
VTRPKPKPKSQKNASKLSNANPKESGVKKAQRDALDVDKRLKVGQTRGNKDDDDGKTGGSKATRIVPGAWGSRSRRSSTGPRAEGKRRVGSSRRTRAGDTAEERTDSGTRKQTQKHARAGAWSTTGAAEKAGERVQAKEEADGGAQERQRQKPGAWSNTRELAADKEKEMIHIKFVRMPTGEELAVLRGDLKSVTEPAVREEGMVDMRARIAELSPDGQQVTLEEVPKDLLIDVMRCPTPTTADQVTNPRALLEKAILGDYSSELGQLFLIYKGVYVVIVEERLVMYTLGETQEADDAFVLQEPPDGVDAEIFVARRQEALARLDAQAREQALELYAIKQGLSKEEVRAQLSEAKDDILASKAFATRCLLNPLGLEADMQLLNLAAANAFERQQIRDQLRNSQSVAQITLLEEMVQVEPELLDAFFQRAGVDPQDWLEKVASFLEKVENGADLLKDVTKAVSGVSPADRKAAITKLHNQARGVLGVLIVSQLLLPRSDADISASILNGTETADAVRYVVDQLAKGIQLADILAGTPLAGRFLSSRIAMSSALSVLPRIAGFLGVVLGVADAVEAWQNGDPVGAVVSLATPIVPLILSFFGAPGLLVAVTLITLYAGSEAWPSIRDRLRTYAKMERLGLKLGASYIPPLPLD